MTNIQSKIKYFIVIILLLPIQMFAQTFDFSAIVTEGCSPLPVTFLNTTDQAYKDNYTYEWVVEPGKFSVEKDVVENTYLQPGKYTVQMKVYNAALQLVSTITKSDFITVFHDPDIFIASNILSDCIEKPFQFSVSNEVADTSIVSYTWIVSDGASYTGKTPPAHYFTYADKHTIFVAVQDANGCTNRERRQIQVETFDEKPLVVFNPSVRRTCDPDLTVKFTNNTLGTDIVSYKWDFADGSITSDKSPTHSFHGYGNYYVSLTANAANGCSETAAQMIQLIDYKPDIVINDGSKTITDVNKACPGTITFTDATTPPGITTSYKWDFGNNGSVESIKNNHSEDIQTGGIYRIKLVVNNGICKDSIIKPFVVEDKLNVVYDPTDFFSCESPVTVTYNATSNVPNTDFEWHISSDTIYGNNFPYVYNVGIYSDTVFATTPNGCKQTIAKPNNIEVAVPHVQIIPINGTSGCVPYTATFDTVFTYNTVSDSIKEVRWDFKNDGVYDSLGAGPKTYIYDTIGVYTAKIEVETWKGCKVFDKTEDNTLEWHKIKVGDIPRADLTFPDTIVCGSGKLIHNFIPDDPSRYLNGYDTLIVMYSPIEPNRFPNPSSPPYTPPSPTDKVRLHDSIGMHTVSYFLSDHGCRKTFVDYTYNADKSDSTITTIRVKSPIVTVEGTSSNCETPYDYSYFFSQKIDTQHWDWFIKKETGKNTFPYKKFASDVDSVHINYNHDTLGTGDYYIKIMAYCDTTNCIDSTFWLSQVRNIKANFILIDSLPCLGDTANFITNKNILNSTGGQDIDSSFWLNPYAGQLNAEISNDQDSVFYVFQTKEFSKVTVVCRDLHHCFDTISKPIKVYQPDAHFFADILSDCISPNPFTTQFTDSTISDTLIVSRRWILGNGVDSLANDSIITTQYSKEGLTSPELRVVDILGCEGKVTRNNYIKPVVPNSKFVVATPKLCLNHEALFVRNTTDPNFDNNIHRYTWDFGDGSSDSGSLLDTVKHLYAFESMGSSFPVKLTAYSMSPEGHECVSSSTGKVEVKDVASKIIIKDMDKCKQSGQKFLVYLNPTWYNNRYSSREWYKVDGGVKKLISNSADPKVITYDNYGTQELILITQTPYYGCENDTTTEKIEVPGYEVDFIADKYDVCVDEDVTFTLTKAVNIDKYVSYWEFGDGNSDYININSSTHAYSTLPKTTDNTFKVNFIVELPINSTCLNKNIYKNITVYPVLADFDRGIDDLDTAGCAPFTITLYNNSVGSTGNNFEWDFGDGVTSKETNPTHTFSTIDSVYLVNLSITSSKCNDNVSKPVSTQPLSNVAIDVDTMICYGETTSIKATGDFVSILWSPSQYFTNPSLAETSVKPNFSGYAVADLESVNGCKSKDSVFLYVQQFPRYHGAPDSSILYYFTEDSLRLVSKPDSKIIAGQLYNVNNTKIEGVKYSWTPTTYLNCDDCASPNIDLQCGTPAHPSCIDFPESISYSIFMTDSLGCFQNDTTITFHIIIDTKAALPQAFSPNNDKENDIAYVRGWGIKKFLDVTIYNRWGQVVYQSSNIEEGWDGTFKGEPQAMDTYAYTIKIINTKDEEEFIKGYITLLR